MRTSLISFPTWCLRTPLSSGPHQYLLSHFVLFITIVTRMKWNLIVVSNYIVLLDWDLHFCMYLWVISVDSFETCIQFNFSIINWIIFAFNFWVTNIFQNIILFEVYSQQSFIPLVRSSSSLLCFLGCTEAFLCPDPFLPVLAFKLWALGVLFSMPTTVPLS